MSIFSKIWKGVDMGAGKDMTTFTRQAQQLGVLREITPADIDQSVRLVGGDFLWGGEAWSKMAEDARRRLCEQHGHLIEAEIYRTAADRARQREEERKAKAAADEAERKEFMDYCQAQHPQVLEEFRRVRLVKSKLARFAGVYQDGN